MPETRVDEIDVTLEMINEGVRVLQEFDSEREEMEAAVFTILYRALALDRNRRITALRF